jgi:hypothetical protein
MKPNDQRAVILPLVRIISSFEKEKFMVNKLEITLKKLILEQ